MEALAEGLWGLADFHEEKGEIHKAVKCLEAICQSHVSFFPVVEVKTRLRIATLLLKHSHNVTHAKSHLERSQLLLHSIPSCFDLKCRAYSLLSQCYHLVGAIPPQKQILNKALQLTTSSGNEYVQFFFLFPYAIFFCELRFVFQFSYNRCVWYSKAFGEVVVLQLQFTASECVDYRRRLSEFNCCFRERLYLCSSNFLSPIAGFVLCLQLLVFLILLCVWNGVLDLK